MVNFRNKNSFTKPDNPAWPYNQMLREKDLPPTIPAKVQLLQFWQQVETYSFFFFLGKRVSQFIFYLAGTAGRSYLPSLHQSFHNLLNAQQYYWLPQFCISTASSRINIRGKFIEHTVTKNNNNYMLSFSPNSPIQQKSDYWWKDLHDSTWKSKHLNCT